VVWEHMTQSEQSDIATLLPDMFKLLLAPDILAMQEDLVGLGIEANRADTIIAQVVAESSEKERIRTGASGSLHAMAKAGIFSNTAVKHAFNIHGIGVLLGKTNK
jgi:hypothetical protein